MRLLNANTHQIEEFVGDDVPRYAILSHTWGREEVVFQEWRDIENARRKYGFAKIQGACSQALRDGLHYVWVDTICIDKSSSAELSEAINSMFAWYHDAKVCYVYLVDIPDIAGRLDTNGQLEKNDRFRQSSWFTRGWALQELLAPREVVFFSMNWVRLGTRTDLKIPISHITNIATGYLTGATPLCMASAAKRMSWMSKRVTTRLEDMAYSMLGIFDINMPLLYGEGRRSFLRLQEEILKSTDDQSIFCWEWNRAHVADDWASILAPCPAVFANSSGYLPTAWEDESDVVVYNITNAGLSINLPFIRTAQPRLVCAVLKVHLEWQPALWGAEEPYSHQVCIPLEKGRIYRRLPFPPRPFPLHMAMAGKEESLYIMAKAKSPEASRGYITAQADFAAHFDVQAYDIGFLLTFDIEDSIVEPYYCSPGTVWIERRSVLACSFDSGTGNPASAFRAALLTVTPAGHPTFMVLLAARRKLSHDGSRCIHQFCQVIPRQAANAITSGIPGLDVLTEVQNFLDDMDQDIDFSSDGTAVVAFGIHIRSAAIGALSQGVRVVYVVSGGTYKGDALREHTDSDYTLSCLPIWHLLVQHWNAVRQIDCTG